MDNYVALIAAIIKSQEQFIGPVIWHVAGRVKGLHIENHRHPTITGDPKTAVDTLVAECERIWGPLGRLECIEACRTITITMSQQEIPKNLKQIK